MPVPTGDDEWFPEGEVSFDAEHRPAGGVTEPAHFGPSPSSSDSGDPVLEPHRGGDEDENAQQDEEAQVETPAAFDPKVHEDFKGLLYLGRLSETFEWVGHTFVIRTLVTDELLAVGLVTKPYAETVGAMKAYQAALVGACVESVDGHPLPLPITNDPLDTVVRNKFDYVRRSWFPPVLDYVYEQYLLLEARAQAVIESMGKASR